LAIILFLPKVEAKTDSRRLVKKKKKKKKKKLKWKFI